MDVRVRLRPWLESRLNDGWIEGLKWIDKEKGIFKIPWKHHSKHTWTEEDAAIFKDWAVVTGRFREGVDSPDWPMWKTRLRCALNKAPDIQEVKQRHNLHCEEPFKVYRFISKTESLWRANATRNASMIFDGIPSGPRLCHTLPTLYKPDATHIGNRKPTVFVQRIPGAEGNSRPFALIHRRGDGLFVKQWQFPIAHSPNARPQNINQVSPSVDLSGSHPPFDRQVSEYDRSSLPPRYVLGQAIGGPATIVRRITSSSFIERYPPAFGAFNNSIHLLSDVMEPEYHQLGVRIQHLNIRVKDTIITNPNGCCIYFGRFDEINSPAAPDPVEAQIPHHVSEVNKAYVDLLLDNMIRGIVLTVVRGSIFAERMCKCVVFVYVPSPDGEYILFKKLGRRVREKIFDYDRFMTELQFYCAGQHGRPHFEVILAFGQQLRPGFLTESLLVWCRVASCRAWFQLHKTNGRTFPSVTDHCVNDYMVNDDPTQHSTIHSASIGSTMLGHSNYSMLNRTNLVNRLNSSNCNGFLPVSKVDDDGLDRVSDGDVDALSLSETLDPHGVTAEQIIEEGVEVPLDDEDDDIVTYDTSGSVMTNNLIETDNPNDMESGNVCSSDSSVRHLFLNHSETVDLKSALLPEVDDVIGSTTSQIPQTFHSDTKS